MIKYALSIMGSKHVAQKCEMKWNIKLLLKYAVSIMNLFRSNVNYWSTLCGWILCHSKCSHTYFHAELQKLPCTLARKKISKIPQIE